MEELWPDLVDTFRALGDYAGERGVRLGLETMFPPTVEQYVKLIHDIAHPSVGATVDTGHVAWTVPLADRGQPGGVAAHNRNLLAICAGLGDKLLHFHVHDVRTRDWRDHREPGSEGGTLDWARLVSSLKEQGFGGVLALEL